MRGSGALLHAVNTSFKPHPVCSRIPHLWAHILSRRSSPNTSQHVQSRPTQPRRGLSSSIPPIFALENDTESSSTQNNQLSAVADQLQERGPHEYTSRKAPAIKRKSVLFSSNTAAIEAETLETFDPLREQQPDRLVFGLLHTSDGRAFVRDADDAAFEKVFCRIDYHHLVEPFKKVYRDVHPSMEKSPFVQPLRHRFNVLSTALDSITQERQRGHNLSIGVCEHILQCAASIGQASIAQRTIDHVLPQHGLEPTLRCINLYMEALCWNGAAHKSERFQLRVLPHIMAIRASNNPPPSLSGHRTSRPDGTSSNPEATIRNQMLALFKALTEKGHKGDESTFTNLMVGMGREADISGVKSILKSVWNIDVDLLDIYDEEEIESPTFYEDGSPLRPSQRLLFSIAHVFGMNNDLRQAVRLVDYVSRNYNVTISQRVWRELCEWALILSQRRGSTGKARLRDTGKMDPAAFEALWNMMTDEPHNVQPDIPMRIMRARLRRDVLNLNRTRSELEAVKQELRKSQQELTRLTDKTVAAMMTLSRYYSSKPSDQEPELPSSAFLTLRHDFIISSLRFERDLSLLQTSMRRTLTRTAWNHRNAVYDWKHRRICHTIRQFVQFLPDVVRYELDGGVVELQTAAARQGAQSESGMARVRSMAAFLRSSLDIQDPLKLVDRIRAFHTAPEGYGWLATAEV